MPTPTKRQSKLKQILSEMHESGRKNVKEFNDHMAKPENREGHEAYNDAMEFLELPNHPDEAYKAAFYIGGAVKGAYRSIRKSLGMRKSK